MKEKHFNKDGLEVIRNGRHECNSSCRRLLVDLELSPKEIYLAWKALTKFPQTTQTLLHKLRWKITQSEYYRNRKSYERAILKAIKERK